MAGLELQQPICSTQDCQEHRGCYHSIYQDASYPQPCYLGGEEAKPVHETRNHLESAFMTGTCHQQEEGMESSTSIQPAEANAVESAMMSGAV